MAKKKKKAKKAKKTARKEEKPVEAEKEVIEEPTAPIELAVPVDPETCVPPPTITQTEALYGFYKWIVEGGRKHLLGGGHYGLRLHNELAKFCKANNLPELDDNWDTGVVYPPR